MTQYEGAFQFLARHFVSLIWVDRTPGPRASANNGIGTPVNVSAFVISVSGEWFLATAGHILQALADARKAGQHLSDFAINDKWCMNRHGLPIPIGDDYIFDNALHVYDEGNGIDCGCIYLRPHYRALLEANGIEPVTEQAWEKGLPRKCKFYVMFGVPKQLTGVHVAGRQADRISNIVWMNIRIIDEADVPDHMRKPFPRFYGRLDATLKCEGTGEIVDDIDGMSGGPIIGLSRTQTGQFCYWVVAIQSGWDRTTRVIAGFPLRALGDAIREMIAAKLRQE